MHLVPCIMSKLKLILRKFHYHIRCYFLSEKVHRFHWQTFILLQLNLAYDWQWKGLWAEKKKVAVKNVIHWEQINIDFLLSSVTFPLSCWLVLKSVVHSWKAAAFFPTNLSVIHAGALAQSVLVTLLASKLVVCNSCWCLSSEHTGDTLSEQAGCL